MTILNEILTEKRKEVETLKQEEIPSKTRHKKVPTFTELMQKNDKIGIIAEYKRASPSKGMINEDVDPAEQAIQYETSGASAISVLTDTPFFKGTIKDLKRVREAVNIPILCKDFIIDPIQIDRAKAAGANMVLLIAAALDDTALKTLYDYASSLDVEVLCEVHNEEEMERVMKIDAKIIGINNRDLNTFKVDLKTTNRLANMVKDKDVILISESGIEDASDVSSVKAAGASAILVGETLMRAASVTEKMNELMVPLSNKEQRKP